MEQKDFKIIKDCFFKSYKSFIDFVSITHNDFSMYSILVLNKQMYSNLSKVSIIIRNRHNYDGMYNEYANNIILTKDIEHILIEDIREDFKDNHYIAYSAINTRTLIQTLQNTKFSLNIKLNGETEFEDAMKFNEKINKDESRHRVLTKN